MRFRFPIRGVIATVAGMMVWAATAASAQDSTDTDRPGRREGRRFRFGDPDRLEWRFRPRVRVDGLRDFDAFGRADHWRGRALRESAHLRGDFARELARWQRDFSRPRMRWYRDQSDWRDEIRRQVRSHPEVRIHPEIRVRSRILVRPHIDLPDIDVPEIRVRPDIDIRPEIRIRPMRIHRSRYHPI